MATHFPVFCLKNPMAEEPGEFIGLQRGHNWATEHAGNYLGEKYNVAPFSETLRTTSPPYVFPYGMVTVFLCVLPLHNTLHICRSKW